MRYFLTILIFISSKCFSLNYYISNAGNDSNDGLSTATSWKTLSKVNGYSTFSSGDSVLLNKGDSWNERLIVPASNLNFSSYGTGNKPIITGFQTLSGFSTSGNVYSITATNATSKLNTVLINNKLAAKCRMPNTGYYNYFGVATYNKLVNYLSGTPNYTGAECVIRNTAWLLENVPVISQLPDTLFLADSLPYALNSQGTGYFLQNTQYALNYTDAWYFSDTAKSFKIYGDTNNIQIATIDTVVWVHSKSNVTFNGIQVKGGNLVGFQLDSAVGAVIQNCTINHIGDYGIYASNSTNLQILSDSLDDILNIGMRVSGNDNIYIHNNYFTNIGTLPGMARELAQSNYIGIEVSGLNTVVTNNQLTNIGYIGIDYGSPNSVLRNNYINTFCFVVADGGAFYTYNPTATGSIISSNIILNGIGAPDGILPTANLAPAAGIYNDDNTTGLIEDSNTVANCINGILNHTDNSITSRYNNLYNNQANFIVKPNSDVNQYLTFTHNLMYNTGSNRNFYSVITMTPSNLAGMDHNYYSNPANDSNQVYLYNTWYSLYGWQTLSGIDINSVIGTPSSGITSTQAVLLYDSTSSPVTTVLKGTYRDMKGNYYNSVTLQPFQSITLFKTIYDNPRNYQLRFKKVHK